MTTSDDETAAAPVSTGPRGPDPRGPDPRGPDPGGPRPGLPPGTLPAVRGYFGIGVETISKAGNVGALMRTAHAFGASFCFFVTPAVDWREIKAVDTSGAGEHVPIFQAPSVAALQLPRGCVLVGVELTDDAVDLPSFRHPAQAAYVLGPEKGSLSPEMQARCDWIVKIPTRFCVNVALAGALVMYDRMIALGRFAERPVRVGGPVPRTGRMRSKAGG